MKIACGIWLVVMAVVQGAGLDFPATLKEIHAAAEVKSVTADFEFTNRTAKPVSIAKYDPTCSCMAVKVRDGKLRYAPGESGLIRAEFDMGNFTGVVDKMVAIWLDNDPADKPSLTLTVRVHIPVLVELEPKTLKWELDGKGEPQTIRITMRHDKPIRVINVTSSSEAFKHQVKTIEEGKVYELTVTPVDMKTPGLGILGIVTDCPIKKYKNQQVFATVRRSLAAKPAAKP